MSASSSEFQAQFSRLFKLAAAMAALLTLACFWRVDLGRAITAVFFFIFHGSAAMFGSILALGMGWRHYVCWSRAKWDGSAFSIEAPRHEGLLQVFDWAAIGGLGVLLTSLISQLQQNHRGLLDHVLGTLAVLVIGIIISHKARMSDVRRMKNGEVDCSEVFSQVFSAFAIAVPAGQAVYYGPGCHVIEAIFWGVAIGVGGFILMRKLRLPEVGGCPTPAPVDAETNGIAGHLVGI